MPLEPLRSGQLLADPVGMFELWFEAARRAGQAEPEAMAVATADAAGRPSVRFVLLREVDAAGFVFYTNGHSRKGREIDANPWAALAFRWEQVDRQVRVRGPIGPVDPAQSDAYFATRPRGSQLAAWASEQSEPVEGREEMDRRLADATSRFEGAPVPRPPWWQGYRVSPHEVEFWQQGPFRMHDRFLYRRDRAGAWQTARLFP